MAFVQDIRSRLVHLSSATEGQGFKEIKINQSGSWTNAELKSGKGKEKGIFPQTKFRSSKK